MPAADGAPLADPRELHKLGPLPGAQAEIRALRRIFGEPRVEVREAVQATEQAVKASRALASAQYVVFSTHGLVAGENEKLGIEEGGLVFTPPSPQRRNLIDDGYLTTSEAARLRLAAELVVLSACNTLSADVSGAAELSGLARAFFYAGARSVLASHWVVSDESTALMIADLFKRMEASPALSRAEAHRAAILELRKQDRWWSPGHWAAFVLVGTPD
jgi:CHAT domain-containing protein